MASAFFALFDDIAALFDDVAVASKHSIAKSASVTGDDLAVSAGQMTGVTASRELPMIWAITKGSLINKLKLIVALLLISYFIPMMIPVLLVAGASYLAFEGVEKVLDWCGWGSEEHTSEDVKVQTEQQRISTALRTDMILSAEILVIALGSLTGQPLWTQVGVLVIVALVVTVFVYGLVAILIRLDDMGFALQRSPKSFVQRIGSLMVTSAPKIMRGLTVVGVVAMLSVAGGIFNHTFGSHFGNGNLLVSVILDCVSGLVAGVGIVAVYQGLQFVRSRF